MSDSIHFQCTKCNKVYSYLEFKRSPFCVCGSYLGKKSWIVDTLAMISGKPDGVLDARVKKLLELRETINAADLVPVLVKEAGFLIKNDPFAFILAAVLDRGTKAEIIWTIPYYIKEQLGTLQPSYFANATIDDLVEVIRRLPVKPRYTRDAPRTMQELSRIIVQEYSGQAQKIWENRTSKAVETTMRRVYGVGPGIASMITLLLERWFKVEFNDLDHRDMDVKADVHVIRVFNRIGFISESNSQAALLAARKLNPPYPGALDSATWMIGRKYCYATNPACYQCQVKDCCPKII